MLNPGRPRDRGWKEWRKSLCKRLTKPSTSLTVVALSHSCANWHWGVLGASTLAIGMGGSKENSVGYRRKFDVRTPDLYMMHLRHVPTVVFMPKASYRCLINDGSAPNLRVQREDFKLCLDYERYSIPIAHTFVLWTAAKWSFSDDQ